MKVLSIKQPFASLIATSQKQIETRSFKTNYRGELYIHSSLKKINLKDDRTQKLLQLLPDKKIEYGMIICKCNLAYCVYMDDQFIQKIKKNTKEYLCGNYAVGRYAWILKDVEILPKSISVKGHLNIWNYFDKTNEQIINKKI